MLLRLAGARGVPGLVIGLHVRGRDRHAIGRDRAREALAAIHVVLPWRGNRFPSMHRLPGLCEAGALATFLDLALALLELFAQELDAIVLHRSVAAQIHRLIGVLALGCGVWREVHRGSRRDGGDESDQQRKTSSPCEHEASSGGVAWDEGL